MEFLPKSLIGLSAFILLIPGLAFPLQSGFGVIDAEGQTRDLDAVMAEIADSRVVYIGETHDRYDHHLNQLEVIRRLHAHAPQRWVIGVEFFARPFQPHLDAYIAGTLSEREFLENTEYFERWGYDYRLYRPIFRFAQEHGIKLLALNAERELTRRVGEVGLEGLTSAERARLPQDIDKSDPGYRDRLEAIFREHPQTESSNFERFLEVQLAWDETMADQIADHLITHPDQAMVVLAGSGHIAFGGGIPNRVQRRLPVTQHILLPAGDRNGDGDGDAKGADFLLVSSSASLPSAGRMGVAMEFSGGVRAREVAAESAAAKAGIKPGDRIVAIGDEPVQSLADVRLALLDRQPGETVPIQIARDGESDLSLQLTLQ